ncbi:DUF2892 family protein [Roseiarcus fermentans]|uniref:DUF2892 family protein n=1 Tax=Roseiarcus fermentans TaxID=1473586 RepID=A0A366F7C6_9HYPH|nr:DUF2892 domain-containing protein [Roseiarcus fermentans]RBP10561.1 DUF2892 family protein [Roseiarcus fermentans]
MSPTSAALQAIARAVEAEVRPRGSRERLRSPNVGTLDRIVRFVLGAALIAFALGFIAPGTGFNWVGWVG